MLCRTCFCATEHANILLDKIMQGERIASERTALKTASDRIASERIALKPSEAYENRLRT